MQITGKYVNYFWQSADYLQPKFVYEFNRASRVCNSAQF